MIDPYKVQMVVVTATSSAERWNRFYDENIRWELGPMELVTVWQREEPERASAYMGSFVSVPTYLGVVPAFAVGCRLALSLHPKAEVFACLHDDCLMDGGSWTHQVLEYFQRHPRCGLLGFGGAAQLGEEQFWQQEYRPHLLVRKRFMSNMYGAEAHGQRVTTPRPVAVLDGFSLVFRRSFLEWSGYTKWERLQRQGFIHHAYDAAMGIFAAIGGWEVHLLPLPCRHLGGQTAVGEGAYQDWARTQHPEGDAGFWEQAHRLTYGMAREYHVPMPIVVPQPEDREECPSCRSKGFLPSVLGADRCTFCDGTEGGNPPGSPENPF